MKTNHLLRVFVLAGLALTATMAFATESFEIRGKIVKTGVAGENHAKVYLLDSKTMQLIDEMTCNEDGEFLIQDVKKGEYLLMVIKPGYKKADTRRIVIDDKVTVYNNSDKTLADTGSKTEKLALN